MKKRTKIGIEDDEEAAVLIEILLKWYRFYLISAIIFLVPFLIFPYGDFDNFFLLALLPYILIIIVMGGFWGLIWYRFLRCPFCHKYVLWVSHRSGSRSGMLAKGYFTPFLPKKCPHCSRGLRVKKEEGARKGPFKLGESN